VLQSSGAGVFQQTQTLSVGADPTSLQPVALGSASSVLVTSAGAGALSLLQSSSGGGFQVAQTITVGGNPTTASVTGGGGASDPFFAVVNSAGNSVSILLGNSDGAYQQPQTITVGSDPTSLALVGSSLFVTNSGSGTVSVLTSNGAGGFSVSQTIAVRSNPTALVQGSYTDSSGNSHQYVAVANSGSNSVSVLQSTGGGGYTVSQTINVGNDPTALTPGTYYDSSGNSHEYVAVLNAGSKSVSVLTSSSGVFSVVQTFAVGADPMAPIQVSYYDNQGNSHQYLAVTNTGSNTISVLPPNPGPFIAASDTSSGTVNTPPLLFTLPGQSSPGTLSLTSAGDILYRPPSSNDQFSAPGTPLNPGNPARAMAVVNVGNGVEAIATADAKATPASAAQPGVPVYTVSLYTVSANASGAATASTPKTLFQTTALPSNIVAGNLTSSPLSDLVIANTLDNSVTIVLQNPKAPGQFEAPMTIPVGIAPSSIALVKINGVTDIVVADQASGDVALLQNDGNGNFSPALRFRAAPGLAGLNSAGATDQVTSAAQTVSVVAGNFTGANLQGNDLAVEDAGAHTISILARDAQGSFGNPTAALTFSTDNGATLTAPPGPMVAGDFTNKLPNNSLTDLAVLMQGTGQVCIYTNLGNGTFTLEQIIQVGATATSLAVVPSADGSTSNLLVGDSSGDVQLLLGNGDGTFSLPTVTGATAALAAQSSRGSSEVLLANEKSGTVTVEVPTNGGKDYTFLTTLAPAATNANLQLAPGDVQYFKLNPNSPYADAIVVASGSNRILVYHGDGANASGQETFSKTPDVYFVGTDPVSVTAGNLSGNRNGALDLFVVNKGSNDVSELFGSIVNGQWMGTSGPRLAAGGLAPIAANLIPDSKSLGGYDLAITNSATSAADANGLVAALQGRGQGFFNDTHSLHALSLPGPVTQPPTFSGDEGLAVVNGNLVQFNASSNSPATVVFTAPADHPIEAAGESGGAYFVAEQGGAVEELGSNFQPVGALTLVSTPTSPLDSPSALQVLQTASGEEVLVSNAGSNTVYVFNVLPGFEGGLGGEGQTLGQGALTTALLEQTQALALETGSGGVSASTSSAGEGALALIVTLGPNSLLGGESAITSESARSVVIQTALSQLGQLSEGFEVGGGDELLFGEVFTVAEAPSIRPSIEDCLRKLDFDKTPAPIDPLNPLSLQTLPDSGFDLEQALAELPAGPVVESSQVAPDLAASLIVSANPPAGDHDLVWLTEEAQRAEGRVQNQEKQAEDNADSPSSHSALCPPHSALLLAALAAHGLAWRGPSGADHGASGRQREEKRARRPREG
jgi:hypothetical protein